MLSKLVTIVIPFKDPKEYIFETIQSVFDQSCVAWECILVDDVSSNNIAEQVAVFIANDGRFRLIKGYGGANVCRNIGLAEVRTDYVMFLDADDILRPDCLKDRIAFFEQNPACDFIVAQTVLIDRLSAARTTVFKVLDESIDNLLLSFLGNEIPWHTMGPLWKTTYIKQVGGFNVKYPRLQDVELSIRVLLQHPKIGFLVKNDSHYFVEPFTELKAYHAQLGILFLLDDYCEVLEARYRGNDNLTARFKAIVTDSLAKVLTVYTSRQKWANPKIVELLGENFDKYSSWISEDLTVKKLELSSYKTLEYQGFTSFDEFLSFWAGCLHSNKANKDYSLQYGHGGDLLYLFYCYYLDMETVDINYVQQLTQRIFSVISNSKDDLKAITYWSDIVGLINVLTLLVRNDLVDTNIGQLFHDFDERLCEFLIQAPKITSELVFAMHVLQNRVDNYDTKHPLFSQVNVCSVIILERVLQRISNSDFHIYKDDISVELAYISKMFELGIYMEVIKRFINKILQQIVQKINVYPNTIEFINTLFALRRILIKYPNDFELNDELEQFFIKINFCTVELEDLSGFKITTNYLIFLNNLIKEFHVSKSEDLKKYIEFRLMEDIAFILPSNNKGVVHGGVIGASGIGLSVISYLHPELTEWDHILLFS